MKFEGKYLRILVALRLRGLSAFVLLSINSGGGYWHYSLGEFAGNLPYNNSE